MLLSNVQIFPQRLGVIRECRRIYRIIQRHRPSTVHGCVNRCPMIDDDRKNAVDRLQTSSQILQTVYIREIVDSCRIPENNLRHGF